MFEASLMTPYLGLPREACHLGVGSMTTVLSVTVLLLYACSGPSMGLVTCFSTRPLGCGQLLRLPFTSRSPMLL